MYIRLKYATDVKILNLPYSALTIIKSLLLTYLKKAKYKY